MARLGPLKGAMPAQKAIQEYDTEMLLEGTRAIPYLMIGYWFALRQILKCFFYKEQREKCFSWQTCLWQLLLFVVVSSLLLLFCSACVKSPSWQEVSIWDATEEDGNVDAIGRHRLAISTTSIIRDTKIPPTLCLDFTPKRCDTDGNFFCTQPKLKTHMFSFFIWDIDLQSWNILLLF